MTSLKNNGGPIAHGNCIFLNWSRHARAAHWSDWLTRAARSHRTIRVLLRIGVVAASRRTRTATLSTVHDLIL
jgi:hypothetical protein